MAVAARQGDDLRGDVFSQAVGQCVSVNVQDFGDTGDRGCGGGCSGGVVALSLIHI